MKQNPRQIALNGFTLAEVLITIVIIGVISAFAIPVIVTNYKEQAVKSALKKNYSVLKDALNMYQFDNGIRLLPEDIAPLELKDKIIKYFIVAKDCKGTTRCMDYTKYKNKTGQEAVEATYFLDDGQFVLNDGTIVFIENSGSFITFSVDVNGDKGPNRFGEDLFMFQLMSDGQVLPMGASGTVFIGDSSCSNTSSDPYNGTSCTQKMLK